jgi:hypothetical protein
MTRALATTLVVLLLVAACSNLPSVTPTGSSGAPPTSPAPTIEVMSPPNPTATATSSPLIVCDKAPDGCQQTLAVVRKVAPAVVSQASSIVIADTCPPPAVCDRLYPFDSLVVLIRPSGIPGGNITFEVTGTDGPERADEISGPIPAHIAAMVKSAGG